MRVATSTHRQLPQGKEKQHGGLELGQDSGGCLVLVSPHGCQEAMWGVWAGAFAKWNQELLLLAGVRVIPTEAGSRWEGADAFTRASAPGMLLYFLVGKVRGWSPRRQAGKSAMLVSKSCASI